MRDLNFKNTFWGGDNSVAFTLAEVLITLGIIGVVAAMTMPTLIQSHKKSEYSTRLKRFYSTMQQAITLSEHQTNTMVEDWSYPWQNVDSVEKFWNTYFNPYFKSVVKTSKTQYQNYIYTVYFNDGSSVSIRCGGAVDFMYDINSIDKGPNVRGKDQHQFIMRMSSGNFTPYDWTGDIPTFYPDATTNLTDRNNLLKLCKKGSFCTQLLFIDGWEFKDDYPQRL